MDKYILTWNIFITKCEENGTGYNMKYTFFSKNLKLYLNVYNLSFVCLFIWFGLGRVLLCSPGCCGADK